MKVNRRFLNSFQDFLLVVPALACLVIFVYYPVMELVRIGFTDWNLIRDNYNYVGLKNWTWLFKGSGARYLASSLRITSIYTAGEITIVLGGGILFALLFNKISRGYSAMRVIIFMPRYVATSSAAVIFCWLLDDRHGIINYFLQTFGLPAVKWLLEPIPALLSILMLTGWKAVGYGMMIYLSAMRGISNDYYEAAELDGASAFQRFFRITLPLLSPTTLFLLVTTFLSSMKVFQSVDVLTGGGPFRTTEVIVYQVYRYAMVDFRMDRAAVVSMFLFILLLIVTTLTMRFSQRSVHYES